MHCAGVDAGPGIPLPDGLAIVFEFSSYSKYSGIEYVTWCNSIIRLLISYPLSFPDPTSGDVKHDHIQQRHCAVYDNTTESVLLVAVFLCLVG